MSEKQKQIRNLLFDFLRRGLEHFEDCTLEEISIRELIDFCKEWEDYFELCKVCKKNFMDCECPCECETCQRTRWAFKVSGERYLECQREKGN